MVLSYSSEILLKATMCGFLCDNSSLWNIPQHFYTSWCLILDILMYLQPNVGGRDTWSYLIEGLNSSDSTFNEDQTHTGLIIFTGLIACNLTHFSSLSKYLDGASDAYI